MFSPSFSTTTRYGDVFCANSAAWDIFLVGSATHREPASSLQAVPATNHQSLLRRVHSTKRALRLIWAFQREQEAPMEEALELFGEIAHSKWFNNSSFILFLNKVRKGATLIHTCP